MTQTIKPSPTLSYSIKVVGGRAVNPRDLYHWLMRIRWPTAIAVIVGTYLFINVVFAAAYALSGGVANARPGSFADAFFFSVQTLGTIGYGQMYPATGFTNILVVTESIVGLLFTALATGLVFVRFSLVQARIVFSRHAAIAPIDGVPTLMVRLGNDRKNQIYDAQMRMILMITSITKEGSKMYRNVDLQLVRSYAPLFARSWNLLHKIDESSPLYGHTPESLHAGEAEITVSVSGVDDTSLQFVHGRKIYEAPDIVFGARLKDVISELPDGNMLLDLRNFHEIVPTEPSAAFPYPKKS